MTVGRLGERFGMLIAVTPIVLGSLMQVGGILYFAFGGKVQSPWLPAALFALCAEFVSTGQFLVLRAEQQTAQRAGRGS